MNSLKSIPFRKRFGRNFSVYKYKLQKRFKTFNGEYTDWDKLTLGEKLVAKGTNMGYSLVIGAGFVGVSVISYTLYKELLASRAPSALFNESLALVADSTAVKSFFKSSGSNTGYVATPSITGSRMQNRHINYEDEYNESTGKLERKMLFYLEPSGAAYLSSGVPDRSAAMKYAVVHSLFVEDNEIEPPANHWEQFPIQRYLPPSVSNWFEENIYPVLHKALAYEHDKRGQVQRWWSQTFGSQADAVTGWKCLYVYIDFMENKQLKRQVFIVDNRPILDNKKPEGSWVSRIFKFDKLRFH